MSKNLSIGFSGPGGSGKTTLVEAIVERYPMASIDSAIRDLMRKTGIKVSSNISDAQRAMVQSASVMAHRSIEDDLRRRGSFVTARTTCDFFCYWKAFLSHMEDETKLYESMCFGGHVGYDVIFYVPPFSTDSAKNDEVRFFGSMGYVEAFVRDNLLKIVTERFGESFVIVEPIDLEERKRFVLDKVDRLMRD